ncbi:LysR family transcriptional regulator [Pseudonocardia sp. CA-107938]|uniref:LysR family transcriptional regulator n=1 Tax=Pseudonocardia sp. CA-107938 TaxID=3240021 RepID=UPI003D89E262
MDDADALAATAPRLARFLAVAHAEHVTRAALDADVPQSTLSRGIARLEADLGVELFVRSGRTLRLSRAGRILLRHVERAAAEIVAGVQEIRGEADPIRGRVGFAFLSVLGASTVPGLLRDFRAAHPHARCDLVQGGHGILLDRLRAGDVDLALTSPAPDDTGVDVELLGEEPLYLVVPAGHRFADRRSIELADAAGEPFVGFLPGYGLRGTLERLARAAGFRPRLAFEGGDVETVRGLVGAGLGVALLPAATHPIAGETVEVPVLRATRPIALVTVAGHTLPPPAAALRTIVRSRWPEAPHWTA